MIHPDGYLPTVREVLSEVIAYVAGYMVGGQGLAVWLSSEVAAHRALRLLAATHEDLEVRREGVLWTLTGLPRAGLFTAPLDVMQQAAE